VLEIVEDVIGVGDLEEFRVTAAGADARRRLDLVGWRLFAVDIGDGWSGYVLSRRPIARGEHLQAVRMTERLIITYRKGGTRNG